MSAGIGRICVLYSLYGSLHPWNRFARLDALDGKHHSVCLPLFPISPFLTSCVYNVKLVRLFGASCHYPSIHQQGPGAASAGSTWPLAARPSAACRCVGPSGHAFGSTLARRRGALEHSMPRPGHCRGERPWRQSLG